MLEWLDQIPYWTDQILQGADYVLQRVDALAIPLGILYVLGNRRARHRLRNARLASALLVELQTVRKAFRKTEVKKGPYVSELPVYEIENGQQSDAMRSVYDGLLASSNIAYFGPVLQKKLHTAYTGFSHLTLPPYSVKDDGSIETEIAQSRADRELRAIDDATAEVRLFYNRHRYRGRGFRLLKMLHLEYGD